MTQHPSRPFHKLLRTGGGVSNGAVDYSDTGEGLTRFEWQPAPTRRAMVKVFYTLVLDGMPFTTSTYGGQPELVNGLIVEFRDDDGTIFDLTDGFPVKNNFDWARLACGAAVTSEWDAVNPYLTAMWKAERVGSHILLNGDLGQRVTVTLNDDFSGLEAHYFIVEGFYDGLLQ